MVNEERQEETSLEEQEAPRLLVAYQHLVEVYCHGCRRAFCVRTHLPDEAMATVETRGWLRRAQVLYCPPCRKVKAADLPSLWPPRREYGDRLSHRYDIAVGIKSRADAGYKRVYRSRETHKCDYCGEPIPAETDFSHGKPGRICTTCLPISAYRPEMGRWCFLAESEPAKEEDG